jgi:hypothetical protein
MPTAGAGTFAYFCCRAKVWRPAGRDPPPLKYSGSEFLFKLILHYPSNKKPEQHMLLRLLSFQQI